MGAGLDVTLVEYSLRREQCGDTHLGIGLDLNPWPGKQRTVADPLVDEVVDEFTPFRAVDTESSGDVNAQRAISRNCGGEIDRGDARIGTIGSDAETVVVSNRKDGRSRGPTHHT